jgi:hypothetical protein
MNVWIREYVPEQEPDSGDVFARDGHTHATIVRARTSYDAPWETICSAPTYSVTVSDAMSTEYDRPHYTAGARVELVAERYAPDGSVSGRHILFACRKYTY